MISSHELDRRNWLVKEVLEIWKELPFINHFFLQKKDGGRVKLKEKEDLIPYENCECVFIVKEYEECDEDYYARWEIINCYIQE